VSSGLFRVIVHEISSGAVRFEDLADDLDEIRNHVENSQRKHVWGVAAYSSARRSKRSSASSGHAPAGAMIERCNRVVLPNGRPKEGVRLLKDLAIAIPRILCMDATNATGHDSAAVVEIQLAARQCLRSSISAACAPGRGIGVFAPDQAARITTCSLLTSSP
jgi:hypothetical protein